MSVCNLPIPDHHRTWGKRQAREVGFCPPDLPPFNDLIEAQEDQLSSLSTTTPSIVRENVRNTAKT